MNLLSYFELACCGDTRKIFQICRSLRKKFDNLALQPSNLLDVISGDLLQLLVSEKLFVGTSFISLNVKTCFTFIKNIKVIWNAIVQENWSWCFNKLIFKFIKWYLINIENLANKANSCTLLNEFLNVSDQNFKLNIILKTVFFIGAHFNFSKVEFMFLLLLLFFVLFQHSFYDILILK